MVRLKNGVVVKAFQPEILFVIQVLGGASNMIDKDIYITSFWRPTGKRFTYHNLDYAIDTRTRNLTDKELYFVLTTLEHELNKYYDIVDKSKTNAPHIHIEFDLNRWKRNQLNKVNGS